jgi:hypothetical protein
MSVVVFVGPKVSQLAPLMNLIRPNAVVVGLKKEMRWTVDVGDQKRAQTSSVVAVDLKKEVPILIVAVDAQKNVLM